MMFSKDNSAFSSLYLFLTQSSLGAVSCSLPSTVESGNNDLNQLMVFNTYKVDHGQKVHYLFYEELLGYAR